jgi:hypothetical protein
MHDPLTPGSKRLVSQNASPIATRMLTARALSNASRDLEAIQSTLRDAAVKPIALVVIIVMM